MADDAYVPPQVEVDPAALVARAWESFRERYPEAEPPADGSLIAWDVETDAATAGETAALVRVFGDWLATRVMGMVLQEPQREAVAATGTMTMMVAGDTTVTVDAGEFFEATGPDGEPVSVMTLAPGTAAQGQTTIVGIPVQAEEPGLAANGATGDLLGPERFPFAMSAALDAPLEGGSDGEDMDAYRGRLTGLATLMAPQPIKSPEFARYVALKVEGVGRAVALDETEPASAPAAGEPVPVGATVNTGVERAVTVGITATDGTKPSAAVVLQAKQVLEDASVTSQRVTVVTANYTTVNIAATVHVWPGYDDDSTKEAGAALIQQYLSPDQWGAPPTHGDAGTTLLLPAWEQQAKVRVSEVVEQLGRVRAVDWTDPATVTINGNNADLTLPGLLPLPKVGTVTITVLPR